VQEEKARELARAMSSKEAMVVAMAPNPSDCFLALAAIDMLSVRRRMKKLLA
jgi:hypothetical protein